MKKNNGITLISLIITIIILLILAGVALNFAIGENGIFKLANNASDKYNNEAKKEESMIDNLYGYISGNRDNITLTKEELQQIISSVNPTGTIISYMGNNVPTGYLSCDGSTYNISKYPTLARQIETEFGAINYYGGDGETTFAVPDLRGEFLRGTGANSHANQGSGASVGEHQDGTVSSNAYGNKENMNLKITRSQQDAKNVDSRIESTLNMLYVTGMNTTGGFTYTSRPTNTSVLYCIKY